MSRIHDLADELKAEILRLFPLEPPSPNVLHVPAGVDLQMAINVACPGDVITLEPGARYVGTFQLPAADRDGPAITIRTAGTLPDRRLTPADAPLLATIAPASAEGAVLAVNTANWRLEGLRVESTPTGDNEIIAIQDSDNIVLDRLLIVAGVHGQRRGIRGNGEYISLTRSHVAGIWSPHQDSQAFCAWDGAGPYTITDNFLEAASENVMFGGARSQSADRIPSDILIARNHFSKDLAWKGQRRIVKNLLELKAARRVLIHGNRFEHCWTDAQDGYAILFTTRNDESTHPWSEIVDVEFTDNLMRHVENGINILGIDGYEPSGQATRIVLRRNVVQTAGRLFLLGGEIGELTIEDNVADNGGSVAYLTRGDVWPTGEIQPRPATFAVKHLTMRRNIARHNSYGVMGDGGLIGTPGLQAHTLTCNFTDNQIAGEWAGPYPLGTQRLTLDEHRTKFDAALADWEAAHLS